MTALETALAACAPLLALLTAWGVVALSGLISRRLGGPGDNRDDYYGDGLDGGASWRFKTWSDDED